MAEREKTPEEGTETPAQARKSPIKLIIVIFLALLVIGGGAAGAVLFLGKGGEETAETEEPEEALPTYGPIIPLGEFTVNLNETSADRYLRIKIDMEVADAEVQAQVEQRMPLIHDTVLLLLSGLRLEDIATVEAKEALKETIRARVERFLRTGSVRQILFQEFLVQ